MLAAHKLIDEADEKVFNIVKIKNQIKKKRQVILIIVFSRNTLAQIDIRLGPKTVTEEPRSYLNELLAQETQAGFKNILLRYTNKLAENSKLFPYSQKAIKAYEKILGEREEDRLMEELNDLDEYGVEEEEGGETTGADTDPTQISSITSSLKSNDLND